MNASETSHLSDPLLSNFTDCENCDSETAAQEHYDDALNIQDDCEDIPIVFLHGMGPGGATSFVAVDSLTKHSTVYVIDIPGKRLL